MIGYKEARQIAHILDELIQQDRRQRLSPDQIQFKLNHRLQQAGLLNVQPQLERRRARQIRT